MKADWLWWKQRLGGSRRFGIWGGGAFVFSLGFLRDGNLMRKGVGLDVYSV